MNAIYKPRKQCLKSDQVSNSMAISFWLFARAKSAGVSFLGVLKKESSIKDLKFF
jgi:hypothetical protein